MQNRKRKQLSLKMQPGLPYTTSTVLFLVGILTTLTMPASTAESSTEAPNKCGGDVYGWCPERSVCDIDRETNPNQYVCKPSYVQCGRGMLPGGWCSNGTICGQSGTRPMWGTQVPVYSCIPPPNPHKCGGEIPDSMYDGLGVCADPEYKFCRKPNPSLDRFRCCRDNDGRDCRSDTNPENAPFKCGGDAYGWCPRYQVCRIDAYTLGGECSRDGCTQMENNPRPQWVCKAASRSCALGPAGSRIEWGWCPSAKVCQFNSNYTSFSSRYSCVAPGPFKCGTIVPNGPNGRTRSELGTCDDPEYQFCRPVAGPNEPQRKYRCCRSDLPSWNWNQTKECLE